MKTYNVTLSRYQRVVVEVEAHSRKAAMEEALRQYDDGEIDEFDWIDKGGSVFSCLEKR